MLGPFDMSYAATAAHMGDLRREAEAWRLARAVSPDRRRAWPSLRIALAPRPTPQPGAC